MTETLSYCYLPDDYEGHRPANCELVERFARGAVYSWPSTTTMHMDLMSRTRVNLDDAHNDGVLADAARQHEEGFIQNEALKEGQEHRVGCSHSRTGRCLCDYIAQWDDHRTPAEELLLSEIGEGRPAGHKYTCFEAGACQCATTIDTICNHHGRGWHRDDNVTCQKWNAEVDTARAAGREVLRNGYGHSNDSFYSDAEFAKIDPTPGTLAAPTFSRSPELQLLHDASFITLDNLPDTSKWDGLFKHPGTVIDQDIKALTVSGEIWEPRALRLGNEAAMEHWKKRSLNDQRTITALLILSLGGWALALARGIWGF